MIRRKGQHSKQRQQQNKDDDDNDNNNNDSGSSRRPNQGGICHCLQWFFHYAIIVLLLIYIYILRQDEAQSQAAAAGKNVKSSSSAAAAAAAANKSNKNNIIIDVETFRTYVLNPPVPAKVPYPPTIQKTEYFSQVGQDQAVDALLQHQREGFFIEVGAYDGIAYSNSLFFEKSRGWTGLLIEANPRAYRELLAADRKAWTTPACISLSPQVEIGVDFLAHGMVGGYGVERFHHPQPQTHQEEDQGQHGHHDRFAKDVQTNPYVYNVKANCFPLQTMLQAIDDGKTTIDMFSLDVEGAELAVLKTIDFTQIKIRVLVIEHNGAAQALDDFLVPKGYRKVEKIDGLPSSESKWTKSDVLYMLQSEFPAHAH